MRTRRSDRTRLMIDLFHAAHPPRNLRLRSMLAAVALSLVAAAAGALAAAHLSAAFAGGVAAKLVIPEDWAVEAEPPPPHGAYTTLYIHELDITVPDYDSASEMVAALVGTAATPAAALTLTIKGGDFSPQ